MEAERKGPGPDSVAVEPPKTAGRLRRIAIARGIFEAPGDPCLSGAGRAPGVTLVDFLSPSLRTVDEVLRALRGERPFREWHKNHGHGEPHESLTHEQDYLASVAGEAIARLPLASWRLGGVVPLAELEDVEQVFWDVMDGIYAESRAAAEKLEPVLRRLEVAQQIARQAIADDGLRDAGEVRARVLAGLPGALRAREALEKSKAREALQNRRPRAQFLPNERTVVEALVAARHALKHGQLMKDCQFEKSTLDRALDTLMEDGFVTHVGERQGFALTEDGLKLAALNGIEP